MTQQDVIMEDVCTFAGLTTASCQSMADIAIYVNLYTRIRAVHPSTCNVVRNAFVTFIRAPHYFHTLGCMV